MKTSKTLVKAVLWGVPVVLALLALYTARTDLLPYGQRLLAGQWKHFATDPLPVNMIEQIYDMGVVDADNDGDLDVYTSNHNFRQFLFLNDGAGRYQDVLGDWKLDQNRDMPSIEQTSVPPTIDRPGLYVYWLGNVLVLRFHAIESLGPVKGNVRFFSVAKILRNDGVELREDASKLGLIPVTGLDFEARRSGELAVYVASRGVPLSFRIDAPWARSSTFVGRSAMVPAMRSGMVPTAAAPSADCAQCLEFEIFLLDRHGMAWSDFNADGLPDVFINRGAIGGTLRAFPPEIRERVRDELLVSEALGRFTDRAVGSGIEKKDCSGRHLRWVDFDHDGLLDLHINCQDRGNVEGGYPKQLYRQVPDKRFEDVAAQVGLSLPNAQLVDLVWFDADGDGKVDLFTHEDTGYFLYRRENDTFVRQRVHIGPFHRANVPGLGGNTDDYWQFDGKLSVADHDADGDLDVFVASKRGNVMLVNDGGTFRSVAPASIGLPMESVAVAWVDYDNDGHMDLHFVPEGLYRGDGTGRFVRTGLLALPQAKYQAAIVNWFDHDNDGDDDVVIALQENASLWRWWDRLHKSADVQGQDDRFNWTILGFRNLTSGPDWLQLQLVGAAGNPEAVGAFVTVSTKANRQTRQVGSHEGSYMSHGHYRLRFGLGAASGPVTVDIRWPDGTVQTLRDVSPNQLLRIQRPG